jgi:membrane protease YdiL (CAAX protease family)
MKNKKYNFFLFIIILFTCINIIPILTFLLTKNEYAFSLSLIPIVFLTLFFLKLPIIDKFKKINYSWGIISIIFPLIIIFILGLSAHLFDKNTNINIYFLRSSDFIIFFLITFIVIYLTEEFIFRGIFWCLFDKIGYSLLKKNFFISLFFVLWHIPVIILLQDFHLKSYVIPIYFLNIFFLSLNFGFFRQLSNSILFISICHSLWNILVYEFFGYGEIIGSWEIKNYILFDPERGIINLIIQLIITIFFIFMILKSKKN